MQPSIPAYAPPLPSPFAGFWLRLVAYIIDNVVLGLLMGVFLLLAIALVGLSYIRNIGESVGTPDAAASAAMIACIFMLIGVAVLASWLYFAWMESSTKQATLGKMALGLMVTDLQGRRISFGRATGRYFSKIITGLIPLFLGWIMAGFTEKKQALHDMIASTLVLKKT